MPNGERVELEEGGHKIPQKVLFKIERVIPHRGKQNRKVFIYRDGEFDEYLWMSDSDLKKISSSLNLMEIYLFLKIVLNII